MTTLTMRTRRFSYPSCLSTLSIRGILALPTSTVTILIDDGIFPIESMAALTMSGVFSAIIVDSIPRPVIHILRTVCPA
ncbi:MAG: hypothetical protein E7K57_00635 [Corynebacterium sp.]|nr:hypothetical protein [Corynebacterium sp.]